MKKVYIVIGERGCYDEYEEWVEKVFLEKPKAENFIRTKLEGAPIFKDPVRRRHQEETFRFEEHEVSE